MLKNHGQCSLNFELSIRGSPHLLAFLPAATMSPAGQGEAHMFFFNKNPLAAKGEGSLTPNQVHSGKFSVMYHMYLCQREQLQGYL